jgi:hypothetical protein
MDCRKDIFDIIVHKCLLLFEKCSTICFNLLIVTLNLNTTVLQVVYSL